MKDTQTETGAAPSNAAGITLESLMNLTRKERFDLIQSYHEAAWACHVVLMMTGDMPPMSPAAFKSACYRYAHGNAVAARIAHDYLTCGKDVKLPVVPPEWYRAMEEAQDTRNTPE